MELMEARSSQIINYTHNTFETLRYEYMSTDVRVRKTTSVFADRAEPR